MRIRLLVEGVPTNDGRAIIPGAIVWDDEPIPVIEYGLDYDSRIVGSVVHVRRESDGSITGETDVTGTITCALNHVGIAVSASDAYVVKDARLSGAVREPDRDRWPWPDYPQRELPHVVCPECVQSKCGNCTGETLLGDDTWVLCECSCREGL